MAVMEATTLRSRHQFRVDDKWRVAQNLCLLAFGSVRLHACPSSKRGPNSGSSTALALCS